MSDSSWRYSVSVSTGADHLERNLGCDDAAICRTISVGNQQYLIAAVSDGAGSARKAAQGAAIATSCIVELLEEYLSGGKPLGGIGDAIVDQWIGQIRQKMLDAADVLTKEASELFTMRDFTATLLFAVVGEDHTVVFQLGDGVIVVDDPDVKWRMALEPQRGPLHFPERRRFTNFVTSDRYEQKRKISHISRRVSKIAIFTDGVEPAALDADDLPTLPGKFFGTAEAFHEPAPFTDAHIPTATGTYETLRHEFFNCAFEVIGNDSVIGLSTLASKTFKDFFDSPAVLECTDDDKTLVLAYHVPANEG